MSIRNSWKLRTIVGCLDSSLAGDLPHVGDLLVQRHKAVQTASVKGNWVGSTEILHQIGVDQLKACCGQGEGKALPSPRWPPLGSDAKRGTLQTSGRKDR